ncbi:nucleotidyltransferase domain-containing protein [Candidatus Woesearchaeota archaeon]|nr:nucleotidyltransferase domain-containing protein [Candidatus Woesearchaeota archaeon]
MAQKDYALEIVLDLIRGKSHMREIANHLNTNHMMIARRIKSLIKDNVLDFKVEGKNKVFFLKKTIEAKNYVFSAETYRLNQFLKKYPSLRQIIEKIQADKKIKLAVVFGSYAKRIAKEDSDIDIYIDTNDKNIKESLSFLNSRLSVKIGKYNKSSLLIKEIEKNKVIIKGVESYYEKNGFFS